MNEISARIQVTPELPHPFRPTEKTAIHDPGSVSSPDTTPAGDWLLDRPASRTVGMNFWCSEAIQPPMSSAVSRPPPPIQSGSSQTCLRLSQERCTCKVLFPNLYSPAAPSLFYFIFFNWSRLGLKRLVSFRRASQWFSYPYIPIHFSDSFPYSLSQDIQCSSLCYVVDLCYFIIVVCMC